MFVRVAFLFSLVSIAFLADSSLADSTCNRFNQVLVAGVCLEENDLLGAVALPYSENGKLVGVRLFRLKSNSLLKKRGFREGDIILRLNGKLIVESKIEGIRKELGDDKVNKPCKALLKRLALEHEIDCTIKE